MQKWLRWWPWVSNGQTIWGLLPSSVAQLLAAPVMAAGTLFVGWHEGIPKAYLLAIATFAFACTTWGIAGFYWVRDNTRVRDRLRFETMVFKCDSTTTRDKIKLSKVQFAPVFKSVAPREIKYTIRAQSSFDGRIAKGPNVDGVWTVAEGSTNQYDMAIIEITPPLEFSSKETKRFDGTLSFVINYGVGENRPFELAKDYKLEIIFPLSGGYQLNWNEVPA